MVANDQRPDRDGVTSQRYEGVCDLIPSSSILSVCHQELAACPGHWSRL